MTQNRQSIRLKNYDYSQEGLYFITICCKDKLHLFGEIISNQMILNNVGEIAQNEWLNTINIRTNIKLHHFVIMPNHFHAIVEITENLGKKPDLIKDGIENKSLKSPSHTLGAVVRGYKSAVSRQVGYSIWQRNYYEHIIRNEQSYLHIAEYIQNNPLKWQDDCFYS